MIPLQLRTENSINFKSKIASATKLSKLLISQPFSLRPQWLRRRLASFILPPLFVNGFRPC